MAKKIWKALDNLSPSDVKLTQQLPRKPDGLHNLKINEYGQLPKRKGYSKYNVTSIGSGHKITGLHRFYKQSTSSKEFLCSWNTDIYKIPDTGDHVAASIKSGLTADSDTYFCDFLNHCYFVNGVDGVFKYNLTNVRTVCPDPPAAKPTGVAQGSGGSLEAGDYKFAYTYVDEDGYEGDLSPVSDAITCVADDSVVLTIVNSSDAKIASRNIYRTSVGGAIYYYDGAVADNTTTTYTSTIADSSLGTEAATNHTAPPTTSHLITKRRSKLYLAYNDYLYPSHTSDVEYFPPLWRIRTGNSQKIMGLLEQLTALPVATEDSIERLVGTDEDNFEFKNSYSTEGCVAMRSYVNCDNLIVYLGFNGINYFDGTTSGIFSKAVNEYIKNNINGTYRHLSCATYFDDKYMLCYPKGASTVPSETIWIDLKNKSYGVYDFAFSCFSLWNRGTDGLQLFGGSNTEGRVYKVFDGLDDDGAAITAYDDIEPLDLGYPELWKQFYNLYIKVKSTTGTALRFYYQLDDASETYKDLTMTANKTLWYKIDLGGGGQRARAIKLRPYISDKYDFTIMGYAVVFELEPPEYA